MITLRKITLLLVVAIFSGATSGHAAPQKQAYLITFGPSSMIFDAFGHTALAIREGRRAKIFDCPPVDMIKIVQESGSFLSDMLLALKGLHKTQCDYVEASWSDSEMIPNLLHNRHVKSRSENRSFVATKLTLSASQLETLDKELNRRSGEQDYDFFSANSNMKIRDVLLSKEVIGQEINQKLIDTNIEKSRRHVMIQAFAVAMKCTPDRCLYAIPSNIPLSEQGNKNVGALEGLIGQREVRSMGVIASGLHGAGNPTTMSASPISVWDASITTKQLLQACVEAGVISSN